MMVLSNYIIVGWSIICVTKTKLMKTRLYEVNKFNIMKVDASIRLMGCFWVNQNGGLG